MSDLTEILKMQWEAYPNAQKTMNEGLASDISLQNARRAQQERMDLKALYAQQAQPSYQQIGAIDPALAQEYLKNQFAMQKDIVDMQRQQAETGKILGEEDRVKETSMANAALPYLNAYEANKDKIPEAENLFKLRIALSKISTQAVAEGRAPSRHSMNPDATYESVVSMANSRGVFTNSQRLQQEASKAQGSQQGLVEGGVPMTPQMAHGSVENDPITGLSYIRPPLRGNQPPVGAQLIGDEGAGYTPEQNAQFNVLQELLDANPDDEALRRSVIAQRQKIELQVGEQPSMPQSEIVTPTQLQTKRVEQKANEEREIKTAQIEATEKAAERKAIETYFRGPKPEAIRNLIKESIEGDVQSGLARLGKFFGVAVPGGDALEALKVIQQQMARSLPYAPGSSSDKDVQNRLEMVSNPATDEPIVNRLRALEEVIRDAEVYVVQKGDFLSEDQILDAVANGYLSEPSALEMINKRMLNDGNPIYAPTQGNKTSSGVK